MTYRVVVFTDGTGTYPAAIATYDDLPQGHVGPVVGAWSRQSDVRAISVVLNAGEAA